MTEKEKGLASDAFKRSCFNWGIGRELYDYPMISIKLNSDEWSKDSGRPKQTYNLKIRDWRWHSEFTDGKLTFLAAKDQKGVLRYKFGALKSQESKGDNESDANVGGLLKKKKDESVLDSIEKKGGIILKPDNGEAKREALAEEYKAIFKKNPHGRMTNDSILKAIVEATEKALDEVSKSVGVISMIPKIVSINDPSKLISWARDVVLADNESSDSDKQEFKDKCNEHYALLTK